MPWGARGVDHHLHSTYSQTSGGCKREILLTVADGGNAGEEAVAEPTTRIGSPPSTRTDAKPKVFISYSRADLDFADELSAGLQIMGFSPLIDRHSILEGEEWKRRLGALIADADTIVFVLSPESATSKICKWEVDEAVRLSKRILAVLWRPIGTIVAPERLAALHYVRFDPHEDGKPRSFMSGLRNLAHALKMDLSWLREHSRLLTRALEWEADNRPSNRLLFGTDIDNAKLWVERRPRNAPEITALHLDFIRASEDADRSRANVERQRLQEVAAAQAEREAAVAEVERAQEVIAAQLRRDETRQQMVGWALTLGIALFVLLISLPSSGALIARALSGDWQAETFLDVLPAQHPHIAVVDVGSLGDRAGGLALF